MREVKPSLDTLLDLAGSVLSDDPWIRHDVPIVSELDPPAVVVLIEAGLPS